MSTQNFTVKDIAEELGITQKDFRRWLRTQTSDRAGRGGSWTFDGATKDELIRRYKSKPARGRAVTPVLTEQADQ